MVATRRSGVNAASIPCVPSKPTKRRKVTVNHATEQSRRPISTQPSVSRNSSMSTNSTAQIRPTSESSEFTLTSPLTGRTVRTPHRGLSTKIEQSKQTSAASSSVQVLAALKRLTASGSSHNPIVLFDNSPQQKEQETPKSEPHMFQDRHSKLYNYKALRPALASRPANGTTFTEHRSHDIYRMRTAKMAAPGWNISGAQRPRPDLSLEMQYPVAARYLGSQVGTTNPPVRARGQYIRPPPLSYLYHAGSMPLNEEQLRTKALQYVREYSRASPRKRKMAEDPDETSESDSTEVDTDTARNSHFRSVARGSMLSKSGPVTILPDPHFQLTPLIERVYPRSTDQKGLREDIAMLASIQNQHLADWLNFEVAQSRKMASPHTPRVSSGAATSPPKLATRTVTATGAAEREKQRQQDTEIRGLLSANAQVWQDGSGLSVADVFSHDDEVSTAAEARDKNGATQGDDGGGETRSSSVLCAAGMLNAVPVVAVKVSAERGTGRAAERMQTLVTTALSPVAASSAGSVVTSSAVRTSGRKRVVRARFGTE